MAKPTSTKTATAGAAKKTAAKPASKATKPTLEKEMGKSVEVAKTKAGKKADTQKKQTEVEKKVEEPVARPVIGKDDKALKDEAKTAEKPVSRKRKSTSDADAKDPEHDPKTIENTSKNAKTKSAKPTAVPSLRSDDKPSKRAKVQVKNPAVTVEATQEEVPLPHVKKAETSSPASKGKAAKGKAVQKAVTGDVAPSAEKPAEGLKSAMKGGKAAAKPKSKAGKKEAEKEDVEMKDVAEGEDDAFIHGFSSSDGEDSSDEEDSDVDMEGAAKGAKKIEAKSLPNVVKDDKEIEQKLAKAKRRAVSRFSYIFLILS
jgi:nucleolar protein 15